MDRKRKQSFGAKNRALKKKRFEEREKLSLCMGQFLKKLTKQTSFFKRLEGQKFRYVRILNKNLPTALCVWGWVAFPLNKSAPAVSRETIHNVMTRCNEF
jgi:hypothetical protein